MEILNRNIAVAEAAKILLEKSNRITSNPKAPNKELTGAILPLVGIRWNKDNWKMVGGGELTHLLYRLRNSQLHPPLPTER